MITHIRTAPAVLALLVGGVLAGCTPAADTEVISAVLSSAETYQLNLASGDEEAARLVHQAEHYAVSEIRRDASTQWAVHYVYEPAAGFVGNDRVELEVLNGSDGASAPTRRRRVSIRFSIQE